MNFKPGDKVWIENAPGGFYAGGDYPAVLVEYCGDNARPKTNANAPLGGWWYADIVGIPPSNGFYPLAHESNMRRRDDPPPQQEPNREAVGDWELCPWRPVSVPKEAV